MGNDPVLKKRYIVGMDPPLRREGLEGEEEDYIRVVTEQGTAVAIAFHVEGGFLSENGSGECVADDARSLFGLFSSSLKRVGVVEMCADAPGGAVALVRLRKRKASSSSASFSAQAKESAAADAHGIRSGWRRPGKKRASNFPRSRIFAEWIVRTFCSDTLCGDDALVLDVAGGKGELAMEFGFRNIKTAVVDPRPLNVSKMTKKLTLGWVERNMVPCTDAMMVGAAKKLWGDAGEPSKECLAIASKAEFIVHAPMPYKHLREWFWWNPVPRSLGDAGDQSAALAHVKDMCTIVVGMHADQATEAIVDMGLSRGIPFAVVPCCVFANAFTERRTEKGGPVRTYDEFVKYLKAKSDRVLVSDLDMVGRRKVVYGFGVNAM